MPRPVWSQFHPHAPSLRASRGPGSARPDGGRSPAPRRRGRERGQVIPLVALCLVVLTGFAALAIDAGLGYDQSRNDQDVADAAALAASYWLSANPTSANLNGAFTVAKNVSAQDCSGPAGPCTIALTFYSASGYAATPQTSLCTGNWVSNTCSGTGASSVTYVGTGVSNTTSDVLANLGKGGSRTYSVQAQAVAAIPGGSGGSGGTSSPCELCVLQSGGITVSGDDVNIMALSGNIDSNGSINASDNGYGWGWDSDWVFSGSTYYGWGWNNANGAIYYQSSYSPQNSGHGWWGYQVYNPTPTKMTSAFTDPLAGRIVAPTITGTYQGTYSDSAANCDGDNPWDGDSWMKNAKTLNPGIYDGMTFNANCTVYTFSPGTYIIGNGGLNVNGNDDVFQGTGVTLYFTCGTGDHESVCSSPTAGGGISVSGNYTFFSWQAPTVGPQRNISYYFDPNDTASFSISGNGFWAGAWGNWYGGWGGWGNYWNQHNPWSGAIYGANISMNITGTGVMLWSSPIIIGSLTISNNNDNWWDNWGTQDGVWIGGWSTDSGSTGDGVANPGVGGYPALVS